MNKELKWTVGEPMGVTTAIQIDEDELPEVVMSLAGRKGITCVLTKDKKLEVKYGESIKLQMFEQEDKFVLNFTDGDAYIFRLGLPLQQGAFEKLAKSLMGHSAVECV